METKTKPTEFKFKKSFTPIKDLNSLAKTDLDSIVGQTHTVKGWVHIVKTYGKLMFVSIYDGSDSVQLQAVFGGIDETKKEPLSQEEKKEQDRKDIILKKVCELAFPGASISVSGKIIKSGGKGQLIDLEVNDAEIIGSIYNAATFLPCIKKIPGLEVIRPHHDERTLFQTYRCMYSIRAFADKAVHDYMYSVGVKHLDPNVITRSNCEGGAEVFTITNLMKDGVIKIDTKQFEETKTNENGKTKDYKLDFKKDFFLQQTYLTESSQMGLETMCRGMGAVYTFNPSFRAEPSITKRHLCCFTHLEWELPFIELKDLMDFSEDLVVYCIKRVLAECIDDLKELNKKISKGVIDKLESFVK
jgi:asparaginyl-tRNA synthetase